MSGRNRQPLYHRAVLLFTATQSVNEERLRKAMETALTKMHCGYIKGSAEIEEIDGEPGDPTDLM